MADKIHKTVKPAGQSADYRFYKNDETTHTFKAKKELRENAEKQPVLIVTVSQTNPDGTAVIDPVTNEPIVTAHSHVVTELDLNNPDYDPEVELSRIMNTVITNKENQISNRQKLKSLIEKW
jgi:hypothetical protein